jgi:hypothetical protein
MDIEERTYFNRLGYQVFGPILLGYIRWIKERYKERNLDLILCPSRDGFIVNQVMAKFYPEIKTSYFYTSRLASVIPLLSSKNDLCSMLDLYRSWPETFTISLLLDRLGIGYLVDQLEQFDLYEGYCLRKDNIIYDKKFLAFFDRFKNDIYINSNSQKELLIKYLMPYQGKTLGFVDLGSGTILSSLASFCREYNLNIKFESLNFQGGDRSYFCNINDAYIKVLFRFSYILLELFFTAPHSSVVKYERERDNKLMAVLSKNTNDFDVTNSLHLGAINYMKKHFLSDDCLESVFSEYFQLGMYPDIDALNFWKNIKIDANSKNQELLCPVDLRKKNIKDIFFTLKSSLWLSGQLTLLRMPKWMLKLIYTTYFIKYKLIK